MAKPEASEPAPAQFGGLRYWFRPAPPARDPAALLVVVHGVRRRPLELLETFAPLAAAQPCHLLVPWFESPRHADYQRLGRPGLGQRADLHLIALVQMLGQQHAMQHQRMLLFGHSAGAQFVHRFVFAHPERVRRYALGAAGWYTLPDEQQEFPLGTRHALPGFPRLSPERFLRVPAQVFVGSRERASGPTLRRDPLLDRIQGVDRLQRATRWAQAMNQAARSRGLAPPVGVRRLPGAAHSFSGLVRRAGLAHQVWRFLFGACPCGCASDMWTDDESSRDVQAADGRSIAPGPGCAQPAPRGGPGNSGAALHLLEKQAPVARCEVVPQRGAGGAGG